MQHAVKKYANAEQMSLLVRNYLENIIYYLINNIYESLSMKLTRMMECIAESF
jgi:hypothetical protein